MTQFVIHAGPHKTGSTYLQQVFALTRPRLAEHGIHYPSVWGNEAHYRLYEALRTIPNPELEAQFAELRAAGHATVLISGEGLSVLPPASVAYLRQLVGPDAPVRIVFYARAWADLLPSQWKQAIKGGETPTLPEFLFRRLGDPAASPYVNFASKLRILARAFGREAIRIVAYDQVMAARRDLFTHFAETFLGLPDWPVPEAPAANVSPNATDIEAIRALAVLERARRDGPIPTPVAVALVARYLRHEPAAEMPALARALTAHLSTLAINEATAALMTLHRQMFDEFGQCLVPPSVPEFFFQPRTAEIRYVHSDYLLVPGVARELEELHRLICVDEAPPARPERAAAVPGPERAAVAPAAVPAPRPVEAAAPPVVAAPVVAPPVVAPPVVAPPVVAPPVVAPPVVAPPVVVPPAVVPPAVVPPAVPPAVPPVPTIVLQPRGQTADAPSAPAVEVVTFRAGGNSDAFVSDGWSVAEPGGRWSAAASCGLLLPRPVVPGDYVLTIEARPFVAPGRIAGQRVALEANETACGEVTLAGPASFRVSLPWEVAGRDRTLLLRFRFADAARPVDVMPDARDRRLLGVAFEQLSLAGPLPAAPARPAAVAPAAAAPAAAAPAAAAPVAAAPVAAAPVAATPVPATAAGKLMLRFESLGENCEFGLVQRRCGVEPLGLLRFSSTPLAPLLKALRGRFDGLGGPGSLAVELGHEGREYMVHDTKFGFRYHAWAKVDDSTPGQVLEREHRRVPLLVRKLVEDLTEGQKIFVYRGISPLGEADIRGLFAAVRAYGNGRLLWMVPADAGHPPGSVTTLAPGLLRGHMDRFAPADNAHDLSLDCWLMVCRNAVAAAG